MSSLSYLKDKYLIDNTGKIYKVDYIRKFNYKKVYSKVDVKITDMKTGKQTQLWAMDYGDFVMSFHVPDPYVTEVLFGTRPKEDKETASKT